MRVCASALESSFRTRPPPAPKRSRLLTKRKAPTSLPPPKRPPPRSEHAKFQENPQSVALLAAKAALDKKASAVEIIDVGGKVDYADYLVLMTGQSDRHVATIAQEVDSVLAKKGVRSISVEGLPLAEWVLLDFVDVVVHVFREESRALYDLDGLWMDAGRLRVPGTKPEPRAQRRHDS